MNDKVMQLLVCYVEHGSEEPDLSWPKHWFEEVSFSRWVAGELLHAIMDHPWTSAKETIEDFAFQMELYAEMSGKRESGRIFSIAARTAMEFLEMM